VNFVRPFVAFLSLAGVALAADSQLVERGRKAERQSCVQCHSLRLVDSQRLSGTAWGREIDKMIGWGAVVPDRQLLLDYLSQEYSDSKPVPKAELSGDGAAQKSNH
jgi:mono/diheme cytochrome c family protein